MSLLLLWVVAGCNRNQSSSQSDKRGIDFARVRGMSDAYSLYKQAHNGAPPKNETEFRDFLATQQTALERHDLTVDDVFKSPRGDQTMTWIYGRSVPSQQIGECYGFEASPLDGKRLVIGARGMFEMMDEAKFRAAIPDGS
jgi:hypothetical protein